MRLTLFAVLLCCIGARAQEARLTGTVSDTTGASVGEVKITATQSERSSGPPLTMRAGSYFLVFR